MKKIISLLVAVAMIFSLSSCIINPESNSFSLMRSIGDIMREIPEMSEYADIYEESLAEYEQEFKYLEENQDELADEIKQGFSDIIDSEISDKEKAEVAKDGVSAAVDIAQKLIFGEGFNPIWPAETYHVNTLYHYKDTKTTGSIYHSCQNSYLTGIDIGSGGKSNVKIYAVEDGEVICSEYSTTSGFGNLIKIQHEDGMVSLYAHLAERNVEVGDIVKKSDEIGIMGNTSAKYNIGEHLHFELADENGGGDAWLTYYKDKYKEELLYESNVLTNNDKYNKDHIITQWIRENYEKEEGGRYYRYKW